MLPFLEPPRNILRPETKAFAALSGVAGAELKIVDRFLVRPLLSSGLWNSMTALYPFIGGSAAAHSINLVAPGTYSIIWSGTVTHDAAGIRNNGSTGWGNTQIPNNVLAQDSAHVMSYPTTAPVSGNTNAWGKTGARIRLSISSTTPRWNASINDASSRISSTATNTGFILSNRIDATNRSITLVLAVENSTQASTAPDASTLEIYREGGGAISTGQLTIAAASAGASLTTAQITAYQAIIQAYQNALGRSV